VTVIFFFFRCGTRE